MAETRRHVEALIEQIKGCEFTHHEAAVLISEIQARVRNPQDEAQMPDMGMTTRARGPKQDA